MKKIRDRIIEAFPYTLPVLTGYLFVGIAFGIFLAGTGFRPFYALAMGIVIFAGSMQFVVVDLLTSGAGLVEAFFMTLMVNARHLFYSLSMLEPLKIFGKKKPYMIYSMTDEMFGLLLGTKPPKEKERADFFFTVALLCQSYWVVGSFLGAVLGSLVQINMEGIDFVMTALFVVIFLDQWESCKDHIPSFLGLGISAISLLLFGAKIFLVPSMVMIMIFLTAYRKIFEQKAIKREEQEKMHHE